MKNKYIVKPIKRKDCLFFILNIHYAKRIPSISFAFGLYENGSLVGCITYGSPASPFLCKGICGELYKSNVIELNRLVLLNNKKNEASHLIAKSLSMLAKIKNSIVVSYADDEMDHIGVVYQAANFYFTGTSKKRTDIAAKDGQHSRHHCGIKTDRVNRSAKHRYVYFIGDKNFKKLAKENLKYPIMQYPKKHLESASANV